MTGRIDITLNKQSLQALEIPNPENKKEITVHTITAQEVKRVLANLHYKVLQTINEAKTEHEAMIQLHENFVCANKELQLKETQKENN